MMDSVVQTLYWCDVANNFHYFSGLLSFVLAWIFIMALLYVVIFTESKLTDEKSPEYVLIRLAKIIVIVAFFSWIGIQSVAVFVPETVAQQKIIKAKIATALNDTNLALTERTYLQKLSEQLNAGTPSDE